MYIYRQGDNFEKSACLMKNANRFVCTYYIHYIHVNAEIIVRHISKPRILTRSFRAAAVGGSNDVHFSFSAFSIKATRLEVHASICQKTLAFL